MCVLFFTFLFICKDIKTINRSSASAWMHCWPPHGGGLTSKEVRSLGWQLAHHCMSWASASDMNHGGVAIKDALIRRRVSADGQALLRRMNHAPPPPPIPPRFRNWKPSCIQNVWLRWLPYKHPIERSSVWSGLFKLVFGENQRQGIYRTSILTVLNAEA